MMWRKERDNRCVWVDINPPSKKGVLGYDAIERVLELGNELIRVGIGKEGEGKGDGCVVSQHEVID